MDTQTILPGEAKENPSDLPVCFQGQPALIPGGIYLCGTEASACTAPSVRESVFTI